MMTARLQVSHPILLLRMGCTEGAIPQTQRVKTMRARKVEEMMATKARLMATMRLRPLILIRQIDWTFLFQLSRHLCLVNDLPPPSQMSKTITFSVKREEETPPLSPMLGDTAIPVGHYLSILQPRFTVLPARHDQW
jgi:hypothetical protein